MRGKRGLVILFCLLAMAGWVGLAAAGHKAEGPGTFKPATLVQGVLKGMDFQKETVTVEIMEGQPVTFKVGIEVLQQLHRNGKIGKRVELRLDADGIVQVAAVGIGP